MSSRKRLRLFRVTGRFFAAISSLPSSPASRGTPRQFGLESRRTPAPRHRNPIFAGHLPETVSHFDGALPMVGNAHQGPAAGPVDVSVPRPRYLDTRNGRRPSRRTCALVDKSSFRPRDYFKSSESLAKCSGRPSPHHAQAMTRDRPVQDLTSGHRPGYQAIPIRQAGGSTSQVPRGPRMRRPRISARACGAA